MTAAISEITTILNQPKGSSIIYHIGHVVIDAAKHRVDGPGLIERTTAEREAINDTAILARRFEEQGQISLVASRSRGKSRSSSAAFPRIATNTSRSVADMTILNKHRRAAGRG